MGLTATLEVTSDGAVTFTFTIENDGDEPVKIDFPTAKQVDFVVQDGEEVWRWSADRVFMQVLTSLRLNPGDSETYEAVWDDPEPGDYTVMATLEGEPRLEVEETFSVS